MRQLLAKDISPFIKILIKMELKETVKAMFADLTEGKNQQTEDTSGQEPVKVKENNGKMVSELVWGIVENYHKAEKDLFSFLGSLEGKTPEEIAELPLTDFINLIMELLSEKNMPFFNLAAK